jgi:hypothetical protein
LPVQFLHSLFLIPYLVVVRFVGAYDVPSIPLVNLSILLFSCFACVLRPSSTHYQVSFSSTTNISFSSICQFLRHLFWYRLALPSAVVTSLEHSPCPVLAIRIFCVVLNSRPHSFPRCRLHRVFLSRFCLYLISPARRRRWRPRLLPLLVFSLISFIELRYVRPSLFTCNVRCFSILKIGWVKQSLILLILLS